MGRTRRTLAIVALTAALVSCNGPTLPASTPTTTSDSLRILTTTATQPLTEELVSLYSQMRHLPLIDIETGNYQSLIRNRLSDSAPYLLTHYLPADSPLWAAPIGQDGIAIIAHPSSGVFNLSEAQLRDIYQGRITRWDAAGGADAEIVVFSREPGSGTRGVFQRLVMGRRPTTANARTALSSEQMLRAVSRTEYSVGYVSVGYLGHQRRAAVQVLTIDGIAPTPEHISASLYPLRTTLFIAGAEEPQGAYRAFIGWVQSAEGQAVLARHYVPLLLPIDD